MEHSEKLRIAGIKKFGSEAKWRAYLAESARKATHTKPQGFAVLKLTNPELMREISRKGGKVTKAEREEKTNSQRPEEKS